MPRQPRIRIPLTEPRRASESAREAVERLRERVRHEAEEAGFEQYAVRVDRYARPDDPRELAEDDVRRMGRVEVPPTPSPEEYWVRDDNGTTTREFRLDPTTFVQANPFNAIPEETTTERDQDLIDSIVDEIRSCQRNLGHAIDAGDRFEADYFRGRINSLQQQIHELEGREMPYRETGYVVHNNEYFKDFLINSQKVQLGFTHNSRRFQLAIQTNRQTYLRKIIALTEARGGLALRRQPVERGMRHGLRVMRRRDGYFVILERKEDTNVTEQQQTSLFP